MFAPFLKSGADSTIDDFVEAIEYVIGLVGEEGVGIGIDFTQGHDKMFFDWITRDKGTGRKLVYVGDVYNPKDLEALQDYPNLTSALVSAGWRESRIRKVLGENWLNLLKEVRGS